MSGTLDAFHEYLQKYQKRPMKEVKESYYVRNARCISAYRVKVSKDLILVVEILIRPAQDAPLRRCV